jgi:SAM-dependent methyltransferase
MPGWPDEGRRIVQGPHLRALLARASREFIRFHRVFNAGAGEGSYSPLLLKLPGVESVFEGDFGYRSGVPFRTDPKQVFFGTSLASIPLAEKTMDLILCTEVLEHIVEDEQALDEITRVLMPGGWLLITVPTPPAPFDPAHVREGYRPEELAGMLAERGFEIVESRFCMYFFFRSLLAYWWRLPWCPRILTRLLAGLDRLVPIGPPMDLMILARLANDRLAVACPQAQAGSAHEAGRSEPFRSAFT